MFTINDFFNLMEYFKSGNAGTTDPNLIITAEDSKAKTTTLFNESIDLTCHSSDDYKRLKGFLTSWYASIRTFNSTMQHATDVRSLPEDHLNTLINSFGFVDGLEKLGKSNKVDFFYDLVNLYKIKGTPECISRVLGYFGISNVELYEYWLKYDNLGKLVFHPESVISDPLYSVIAADVDFNDMIMLDPHWFLTADQVNQLFSTNKIAFPSKSPYFGIRPIIQISGGASFASLVDLYRIVQESYLSYIGGNPPVKDYTVQFLSLNVSILDLYCGIIYLISLLHPKTHDSSDENFLIWDGTFPTTLSDIETFNDSVTLRINSNTRDQVAANKILYDDYFSRLRTTNFLSTSATAGNLLTTINPDLKAAINSYFSSGDGTTLLKQLLNDLSSWMRQNIGSTSIDLASLILGFESIDYLMDVINFFKPYRARFVLGESVYLIKNPALDSVISEDLLGPMTIIENAIDWDTADSAPCCLDSTSCVYYSRETYDCGSYFDVGASMDTKTETEIYIRHEIEDIYNYHKDSENLIVDETSVDYIVTELDDFIVSDTKSDKYISSVFTGDITGEKYFFLQDGGFIDFDFDGVFDAPQISDVCEIYISSAPSPEPM